MAVSKKEKKAYQKKVYPQIILDKTKKRITLNDESLRCSAKIL